MIGGLFYRQYTLLRTFLNYIGDKLYSHVFHKLRRYFISFAVAHIEFVGARVSVWGNVSAIFTTF